jgi:hypothetical protein
MGGGAESSPRTQWYKQSSGFSPLFIINILAINADQFKDTSNPV